MESEGTTNEKRKKTFWAKKHAFLSKDYKLVHPRTGKKSWSHLRQWFFNGIENKLQKININSIQNSVTEWLLKKPQNCVQISIF